jgi:hypothetical protein
VLSARMTMIFSEQQPDNAVSLIDDPAYATNGPGYDAVTDNGPSRAVDSRPLSLSANLLNLEQLKSILLLIEEKSEELTGGRSLVLHNGLHMYFLSPSEQTTERSRLLGILFLEPHLEFLKARVL